MVLLRVMVVWVVVIVVIVLAAVVLSCLNEFPRVTIVHALYSWMWYGLWNGNIQEILFLRVARNDRLLQWCVLVFWSFSFVSYLYPLQEKIRTLNHLPHSFSFVVCCSSIRGKCVVKCGYQWIVVICSLLVYEKQTWISHREERVKLLLSVHSHGRLKFTQRDKSCMEFCGVMK